MQISKPLTLYEIRKHAAIADCSVCQEEWQSRWTSLRQTWVAIVVSFGNVKAASSPLRPKRGKRL